LDNTNTVNTFGSWVLAGGTIVNGNVTTLGTTKFTTNGTSTFNNVTLTPGSNILLNGGDLALVNGFTDNGLVTLNSASLTVASSQTVGGTGTIFSPVNGGGGGSAPGFYYTANSVVLTIANGLTIHGEYFAFAPNQFITGSSLVNHGLINADTASAGLSILTAGFTNASDGVVEVTNANTQLSIAATNNWTNAGQINLTAGTLNLGGSFSTGSIGTINRTNATAGTVNLTGTLTNTSATLTLDTTNTVNDYGSWVLIGTIVNGNVTTMGSAQITTYASPTLNNVTLTAGSNLILNNGNITLVNGFTDNGLVTLSGASFWLASSQTVGGTGTIYNASNGAGGGSAAGFYYTNNSVTLTIANGLTVHGGFIAFSPNQFITGSSLVNHGILNDDINSAGLYIQTAGFTNASDGLVEATVNGSQVNINPTSQWTNNGTVLVQSGGLTTFSINPSN
jgi:hypothetical protein